jgi:hypothetical protein
MISITANGITRQVPAPAVYEVTFNPQQSSAERNGNGKLVRQTLPDKWSLQLEWRFKTPQESYDWFAYLKTLTRIDFSVTFPTPAGTIDTATFYISPISAKMLSFSGGVAGNWKDMKCTFVEV